MPNSLAALLVDEGAVSADAMERALVRQHELGGAIDTALLEDGAISEETLVPLLSRAAHLPPAPEEAWTASDARARRVFPSRVAERHGLAPFALDGRELSIVATYPVDLALLDEISFMLSLHLTAHVAPEWRVRELIHRLYGVPLSPRLAALCGAGAVTPGDAAGPGEAAEHLSEEQGDGGGEHGAAETAFSDAEADEAPPTEPAASPAASGFPRDASEPLEPLAAALAQALDAADLFEDLAHASSVPVAPAPDAEGSEPADQGGSAGGAEPEEAAQPDDEGEPGTDEPRPPPDRSAPPRWSLEDARAALAAAADRDEVVLAALRYARDFFEFAAMFAVTRDAVAGHDALGREDDARDRCRGVAIYTSDPGIFRTVIDARSPHLGPFGADAAGNVAILSGLGRGTPRTVLVHPILLRDRAVCVLYADNGEAPVSARRLGDLVLVLSAIGPAFERIIRERKKRKRRRRAAPAPVDVAPPSAPEPPAVPEPAPAPALAPAVPEPELSARPPAPLPALDGWTAVEPARAPSPRAAPPPAAPAAADWTAVSPAAREPDLDIEVDVDVADLDEGDPAAAAPAAPLPPEPAEPEATTPAALADRALDADDAVAARACEALAHRRRDPDLRLGIEKLRRALLSGISGRTARAARAIAALRDAETIPLLVQVLETSDLEPATAAADALAAITLQRLGRDPRKWLAWWKENRGRGRAEWLFTGLTSPDRDTRVAASVELSSAAPPPVAYSADMPPPDREKAARAWAGWWARSGHVL